MSDSPYDFAPERQRRFIAELESHGGVAAAARAVEMTPQRAYPTCPSREDRPIRARTREGATFVTFGHAAPLP